MRGNCEQCNGNIGGDDGDVGDDCSGSSSDISLGVLTVGKTKYLRAHTVMYTQHNFPVLYIQIYIHRIHVLMLQHWRLQQNVVQWHRVHTKSND